CTPSKFMPPSTSWSVSTRLRSCATLWGSVATVIVLDHTPLSRSGILLSAMLPSLGLSARHSRCNVNYVIRSSSRKLVILVIQTKAMMTNRNLPALSDFIEALPLIDHHVHGTLLPP